MENLEGRVCPDAVTLNYLDSGWWDRTGFHDSTNKNYISGQFTSVTFNEDRDYFVFDLSAVTGRIVGAQLRAFNPGPPNNGYVSPDAQDTYALFDVSTPIPTLRASGSGQPQIYDDLGSGVTLGSRVVSNADNGQIVEVNLNADGVDYLNAARGGQVALGGALTTIQGPADRYIFGYSAINPNDMRQLVVDIQPAVDSPINGPFNSFALPPCDDCSSPATPLGFTFDLFGVRRNTVWVNNNGSLTFDGPFGDFVPGPLASVGQSILAPYWGDVYTNGAGLGQVTYGAGTLDSDPAFGATWENVAPYLPHGQFAYFQVVIADHTARLGYYEVQFNYLTIQWDHTDSSDQAPRVGYSNAAGASAEFPGSGTFDALIDGGPQALQTLRRFTFIIYPSSSPGPGLPGDAARRLSAAALPPLGESYASLPAHTFNATPDYANMQSVWTVMPENRFLNSVHAGASLNSALLVIPSVQTQIDRSDFDILKDPGLS